MKYLYEFAILVTPRDVPKGYSRVENVSVLRGPNFCISTASAHLVSHGSCQISYEVRVIPTLPIQKKGICFTKKFWRCLAPWEYAWEDKRDIMPDVYSRLVHPASLNECYHFFNYIFRRDDTQAMTASTETT